MGENGICVGPRGAQDLLIEFQQTGREEPFAEIARRYAGMVYNVALQVTRDAHDAEDAAQATFLTLAVHARTAGKIRYLGPWLRKVSHRLALDIRRSKKRRKAREEKHANGNGQLINGEDGQVSKGMQMEELRHILREELDKLPAKYRMPLILYYFGGLSPEEMGKELQVNTSTLGVRLHRGRKMLADSLSGRGITINASLVAALLGGLVDSFVTDGLVRATSHSASRIAAHGFVANGVVSMPALNLIHSAGSALAWGRFRMMIGAAVLLATTLAGGAEALRRLDIVDFTALRNIQLIDLIRPLLDRIGSAPSLRVDATSPTVPNATAPADSPPVFVDYVAAFTLKPSPPANLQPLNDGPTEHVTHSIVAVGNDALITLIAPPPVIELPAAAVAREQSPPAPAPERFALADAPDSFRSSPPAAIAPAAPATAVASLPRNLTIDRANASIGGVMTISRGHHELQRLIVGETTDGTVVQTAGEVVVTDAVILAVAPQSTGTYQISGDATLTTPSLVVGAAGHGTFVQDGGVVAVTTPTRAETDATSPGRSPAEPPALVIARDTGSTGAYILNGGTLLADTVIVGKAGSGSFEQHGGTAVANLISVGELPGSTGRYTMFDGGIELIDRQLAAVDSDVAGPLQPPAIVVGDQGDGQFVIRASRRGIAIQETDTSTGGALLVRVNEIGEGVFRGWGAVRLTGPIVQNGQVIADGFGSQHFLDLSSARSVINTIDNPADGTNGWFARDGGALLLPPIDITGPGTYTWGEASDDPQIDLINSLRLTVHGVTKPGFASITLLSPDQANLPALPDGIEAISLWLLQSTAEFSSIDLMLRYDDLAAAQLRLAERDLGLWVFNDSWSPVINLTAGIDVDANLIWGSTGKPTYIAIADVSGVPEPAALLTLAAAGSLMLRRRRR